MKNEKKWYINYALNQNVLSVKLKRFVKEQKSKGLLSNLGIKAPLSKIPFLNVLFEGV